MNRIHQEWITTMNMHEMYTNEKTLEQIGKLYGCTKNAYIKKCGWKMLRFWEHEIHSDIGSCVNKIKNEMGGF
jgi:hypothetical protein